MSTLHFAALWLLQVFTLPQPVGYVNDFAGIINADAKARIEAIAADVKNKSGGEIVVVTLPSLGGRPPEEIALRIGREWKVGQAGGVGTRARNAGTIIMLAPNEREVRVEVGSGAEGFLTDGTTGAIQDEALPFFRANNYSAGLELIALRVAERYATEYNFTLAPGGVAPQPPVQPRVRRPTGGGINPIVLFIIFMIIVSMMGGRRGRGGCLPIFIPMGGGGYRGGGWGGGGGFGGGFGGGGFGGFGGGGGFSGGGSGRSW